MYVPDHFSENRVDVLHGLIRARPLATLVTTSSNGLAANHIPMHLAVTSAGQQALYGHVARQNPLWQEVGAGTEALAIFQGPLSYISPSWYPDKREHGRVVPTWNYVVVHARGDINIHDDPTWTRDQIQRLTQQMESAQTQPWALTDAPPRYIEQMTRAIVGIELVISSLVGKWKVSQNQSSANRLGAATGLEATGEPAAQEMAKLIRQYSAPNR